MDSYRPPHVTRHAATDCFRGQMLHEITCLNCNHVSRTVDEFTSLTVELPTHKQRTAYYAKHPGVPRYDAAGALLNPHTATPAPLNKPHSSPLHDPVTPKGRPTPVSGTAASTTAASVPRSAVVSSKKSSGYPWWNPFRYLAALMTAVSACFFGHDPVSHALTLEECLDVYFQEEVLSGSNRYLCPQCLKHTTATKRHSVLWYPEYLMVHMKRFEMGSYWTSKRSEPVIFPVGSDLPSSCLQRPLELSSYGADALRDVPASTSYRLAGVVNHHGGYSGGHYTTYAKKDELGWVLCNDGAVARVREETVAESEEYVLLYAKMPPRSDAYASLAKRAEDLLFHMDHQSTESASWTLSKRCESSVMISRAWLHRVATFVEPGPLLNRTCYCRPSATLAPHAHGSVLGSFVPIPPSDFSAFVKAFGGPPEPMTVAAFQARLEEEQRLMHGPR